MKLMYLLLSGGVAAIIIILINKRTTQFTEEGTTRGVADDGKSFAVAYADIDADGDLDIFVTNSGSSNRLYINVDGKGNFEEATIQAGLVDKGASRGAAFADVNGDGLLDLYVLDTTAPNRLYLNHGNGHFLSGIGFGAGDKGRGQGACFADVDGDGDLDLFVANFAESNNLYLNDGKGFFENATAKAGLTSTGYAGFGCAFGDIDEDGDLDLYVTNSGQHNKLYVNDGKGAFTDKTTEAGVSGGTGQKRAVSFGDLNGDGHLDLYLVGPMVPNQLFLGDGTGHFTDGSAEAGVGDSGIAQGMNLADVDGDGDLDIFVSNIGQPCILYENDGHGHFKNIASKAGVNFRLFGQGVGFGDINGDGALDMFVANWANLMPGMPLPKNNMLFINHANIEKWLKVKPLDQKGRPTLLGTEVRLYEAGTRNPAAVRMQVDGGSAFASQNAYDAYFGLSNSGANEFDIEMRCGGAWVTRDTNPELGGIAPNQVVKVKCAKSEQGVAMVESGTAHGEFYYSTAGVGPNCCTQLPAAWVNRTEFLTPRAAYMSGHCFLECAGNPDCPSADVQWIQGSCASVGRVVRHGYSDKKDDDHYCTNWCSFATDVVTV